MAHIRLHVQQADGHLPMVCMRCGEPASVVHTKTLRWYPRWIAIFILVGLPGLIIMVILAMAMRKWAMLRAPLCEQHQGHWTTRQIAGWVTGIVAIVLCIGGLVGFIALENARPRPPGADALQPILCIGTFVLFIGWLIGLAIMNNTTIRPEEITSTHILLNGVSEAFVDAVEEAEIERRVRLRQMQEEDEIDRPRRVVAHDVDVAPPRPKASDAIEEERPRRAAPPGAIEE